jgi:WD40 repeat protein
VVTQVAFVDGAVGIGISKHTVKIWNVHGRELGTLPRDIEVWDIGFSSDGALLASASGMDRIAIWGWPVVSDRNFDLPMGSLVFIDGTLLAAGSFDTTKERSTPRNYIWSRHSNRIGRAF